MKIVKWTTSLTDEVFEPDYLTNEEYDEMFNIVVKEVREKGYHFDGTYHQNGEYGMPLFDNGKYFATSMRTWGLIMAKAFPEEYDDPDNPYGYIRWYLGPMTESGEIDYGQYVIPKKEK